MSDESIKDQIKEAIDLVAVIGAYVTLKQRGANWIGLCPFHTEKTPSFNVTPARHFFHCFGCGKGGDVFAFLMEHEGWSFPEALRFCADKTGIALPSRREDDDREAGRRRAMLDALSMADTLYRRLLFAPEGRPALEYLHGRGFGDAVLKEAGVGFAPPGFDRLLKTASAEGVKTEMLEAAGLVGISQKSGRPYDRFRNRITFPIVNLSGHTVGFGARVLSPDDQPKYLNSPETPLYHKNRILYGLAEARDAIRKADRVLIVEGYLDWLRMIDSGLNNVVAISGTALTDQQAELLTRFGRRVTLLFDADSAGQRAALRGIGIAINAGLGVDVAALPAGDDPDSFLQREGPDALRRLIERAPSIAEYRVGLARTESGGRLDFLVREKLIKEFVALIRVIDDRDRRETFLGEVAGYLEVSEDHLRQSVRSGTVSRQSSGPTTRRSEILIKDEEFLRVLIDDLSYLEQVRGVVLPTDFQNPLHQKMYVALLDRKGGRSDAVSPEELGQAPDEIAAWSKLLSYEIDPDARGRIFRDTMTVYAHKRRAAPRLKQLITQAERAGDRQTMTRLTGELADAMRLDRKPDSPALSQGER